MPYDQKDVGSGLRHSTGSYEANVDVNNVPLSFDGKFINTYRLLPLVNCPPLEFVLHPGGIWPRSTVINFLDVLEMMI